MARPANSNFRQQWYENMLEAEEDPRKRFEILRSKLAADVKRLPDELRDGAYASAGDALKGVIEAIEDAIGDIRPMGV